MKVSEIIDKWPCVPSNEMCYCGHTRSQHAALMLGMELVDVGHGQCEEQGCRCLKFTWHSFVSPVRAADA